MDILRPHIDSSCSSPLTEPPTITLTARRTGGPPANVEWTIDDEAISNSTAAVNIDSDSTSDRENARYTHTLMVRGRQSGVIRFAASNNRISVLYCTIFQTTLAVSNSFEVQL